MHLVGFISPLSIFLICDALLSCRHLPSLWWTTLPLTFSILQKVVSSQMQETSYSLHGVTSETSLILTATTSQSQVSNFKMVAFSLQLIGAPLIFNASSQRTHVHSDLHINIQVNPTGTQTHITVLARCIADLPPFACHPMCLQTRRFIKRIITVPRPVTASG